MEKLLRGTLAGASAILFLAAASLIVIGSCTKSTYDKKRDSLDKKDQKALDEYRAELEIGRNMAGRLLQFYGTQTDTGLLDYVNQVGSYVASQSDFPDKRYMFEIIDSEIVNAFACPGGYILLTVGAIRHAKNEAELAHILGHEVAHVGKKHMFNKLKTMSAEDMDKANEQAKETLKIPDSVKARERPHGEESEMAEMLAKYLSGGAAGLNIVKAAGAGMAVMLDQGLGADLEYEADQEGVKYAVNAGYNPKALTNYLCRLEAKKGGEKCDPEKLRKKKKKKKTILDKTHPAVADRIANINKTLRKLKADVMIGAEGKKRFKRFQKRLAAKEN